MAVETETNWKEAADVLFDVDKVVVQFSPAILKMYSAKTSSSSSSLLDRRLRFRGYLQSLIRYVPNPLAKCWQLWEHTL